MDLRSLETFLEVAERSSFTRAGEYLGYSQPTVSFQIRQLEQELGVPLFDRIGHTVTLTDAGREALDYAQRICNLSREMTMGARQDQTIRGSIRLGMADSLCDPLIARNFHRFRRDYPGITLRVFNAAGFAICPMSPSRRRPLGFTLWPPGKIPWQKRLRWG